MNYTFKLSARLARLRFTMLLLLIPLIGCVPDGGSASDTTPIDSTVLALSINPHVILIDSTQVAAFAAFGRMVSGDSLPLAVVWGASGGSVDANGVFSPPSTGIYDVWAQVPGANLADTARVYVSTPAAPGLASVVVTPATATIDTSETLVLHAYGRNTAGDSIAVAVNWVAPGAGISAAGNFKASTAGSYLVFAVAGSKSDTAQVTVTAPAPPPPPPPAGLVNECSAPQAGWIFCDDFDQDRLSSYFEYAADNGSFVRANGVGNSGSYGMKARYAAGQVNAGSLHLAFGKTPQAYFHPVDAGTANYREVYWRFYLRYQPGWTGGGGIKLTRAFSFASPTTWSQSMFGHVWSGGTNNNYLALDPASGTDLAGNLLTTTYNDFANMRWLGVATSTTPIFDAVHVGAWYCIEAHVKLNTAGQSNGLFELWINDTPEASRSGLNWLGNFSAYGINAVYLENHWSPTGGPGSPVTQERYFDNLVVSTQRIGC